MARVDLPPDFLQSPLLPGLEVARNSGFVDSTAFHGRNPAGPRTETTPIVGKLCTSGA